MGETAVGLTKNGKRRWKLEQKLGQSKSCNAS